MTRCASIAAFICEMRVELIELLTVTPPPMRPISLSMRERVSSMLAFSAMTDGLLSPRRWLTSLSVASWRVSSVFRLPISWLVMTSWICPGVALACASRPAVSAPRLCSTTISLDSSFRRAFSTSSRSSVPTMPLSRW